MKSMKLDDSVNNNDSVKEFIDRYLAVRELGWVRSHRSNNTGIGKTLEDLLKIDENNLDEADIGDVEIKSQKVEPKESIRGEIARTYLYMDSVYPDRGIISKKNRKLFNVWNKNDPVDQWECERARRIEKIQGNRNEVVMRDC